MTLRRSPPVMASFSWSQDVKPIGFVSYGASGGGLRAVEQLRQVAIELKMAPVRRHVAIPRVWEALDGSGVPRDPQVTEQARALLDEMAW